MPKTRSGRTSRPSVEDEDDDEEEPLQTQLPTLEEHDDSRARPQAAKKPTPKPQQAVPEKKSTASKAKDAAEADEDDDRTTPAAKTSVNISVKEEFQSDHDDDDGPTDAELAQLSLRYKDEMLYDVLDYELELILSDRASRKTHFPVFEVRWFCCCEGSHWEHISPQYNIMLTSHHQCSNQCCLVSLYRYTLSPICVARHISIFGRTIRTVRGNLDVCTPAPSCVAFWWTPVPSLPTPQPPW
jgi:hypothetical protein